jgi:glycosyltransferase involved in cell wall biosynthesis
MSYGNCVVVNGTPENLEVIADAGVSFPKNDFAELAGQLDELLKNPKLVAEYGERARHSAQNRYSWDAIVERYERLLLELVERKRFSIPSRAEQEM